MRIRIASHLTAFLCTIALFAGCASPPEPTPGAVPPAGQSSLPVGMRQDEQTLIQAASNGDLAAAERLVKDGTKVDGRSKDGMTALMTACSRKQSDMVRFLLAHGASPNLVAAVGEGEDTGAWTFGYVGICKDEQTTRGATPLFFAAQAGAADIARMLVERGADVDMPAANGATALYIACQMGNRDVVKVLLAGKSNPNARTTYGWTPLLVTAYKGDVDIAQLLLDRGADVNATGSMLMAPNKIVNPSQAGMTKIDGVSALYIAALAGKPDVARLLLSRGARPDMKTSEGETPMDAASFVENDALVQLLKEAGLARQETPAGGVTSRTTDQNTTPVQAAGFPVRAWVVPPDEAGKPPKLYWEHAPDLVKGFLLFLVKTDPNALPSADGTVRGSVLISIMPPDPPMDLGLFPQGVYTAAMHDGRMDQEREQLSNAVSFEIK